MTGWKHVGPGGYEVIEGLLKPHGGMGLLWYTPEKIGNAVVRVVFKTEKNSSNSGVFIRIPDKPTEPWMPVNRGIEVQIDNSDDDYHCTGVLYSMVKALARPQKPPGEWNTMDITLDGPHTVVTLNGVKVTDYTEGQPVPAKKKWYEPNRGRRPDTGYIGLQNHSDNDIVYFKEVAIKKLSH
jgi:3-keto-disaccharide hydrolase